MANKVETTVKYEADLRGGFAEGTNAGDEVFTFVIDRITKTKVTSPSGRHMWQQDERKSEVLVEHLTADQVTELAHSITEKLLWAVHETNRDLARRIATKQ